MLDFVGLIVYQMDKGYYHIWTLLDIMVITIKSESIIYNKLTQLQLKIKLIVQEVWNRGKL